MKHTDGKDDIKAFRSKRERHHPAMALFIQKVS